MTEKKMTKGEALDAMRQRYPQIASVLHHADEGAVLSMNSALEATVKNGYESRELYSMLEEALGTIRIDDELRALNKPKASAKDSLSPAAESLARVIETTAKNGHDPKHIVRPLAIGLMHSALKPESIPRAARYVGASLNAAADSGYDPKFLAQVVALGLGDRTNTLKSIPHAAKGLGGVLEAAADAGQDPTLSALTLMSGMKSKAITNDALMEYAKLLKAVPRAWKHSDIINHAIEARKLGVPAEKIPTYQMRIVKKGHFPNAGLVHELHKATRKEALKARRNPKR